ncbi:MAG: CdaR family protein [Eubacteriaceae bacterium]|nr:CdaR family protein [Eubacteriaceae bacterium]
MKNSMKSETKAKVIRIIIAVFLAIFMWVYVNGSSIDLVSQEINSIPVTLTNSDTLAAKGLVLDVQKSYYVNLRIKGTEKNIEAVKTSEITAEVDLKDINEAGSYTPKIVLKGLPNSITMDEVKPETLQLQVDKIEDKDQSVTINASGKPGNNLSVISAETNDTVKVSGSSDDLAKISSLNATANVQGLMDDATQFLEVQAVDASGNVLTGVECQPKVVKADIVLGNTKEVPVTTPKTSGDVSSGYKVSSVTVNPSSITIGGKQAVLDQISSVAVSDINVSGAVSNVTSENSLSLPNGVTNMDGGNKVKVTAAVEALIEKSYTVDTVEKRNVPEGLTVSKLQDSSVVVKLSGTASELQNLDVKTIAVWVDLTGKAKGKSDVQIQVKSPKGSVKSVSPEKTFVTLEESE